MYCKKCGAELDEKAKFCVKCGTKVDVNITEPKVVEKQSAEEIEEREYKQQKEVKEQKTKKPMPAKTKGVIAVVICLLLAIGVGIGIGIKVTSPDFCIEGYAKAIADKQWEKVFNYTTDGMEENKDAFAQWADINLASVSSYTINEVNEGEQSREYEVIFTAPDGTEIYKNQYLIQKQQENKMLVFPNWKIEKENLMVEEAGLTIPAGTTLFVDGTEMDTTAAVAGTDGNIMVSLTNLYAGPHSIKLTKQFYQDYEDSIQITEETVKKGLPVLSLTISDTVVQDIGFSVLNGSALFIDDVQVENEYKTSSENGVDIYTIPFLEKGEHKLKVTKKYYNDYETTIQVESAVAEPIVAEQTILETEAWRAAYQKFLTAVMTWDMETIEQDFEEIYVDVNGLYQAQDYQRSAHNYYEDTKFAIFDLNTDETPEIYIENGFVGMVFTYADGEVKAAQTELTMYESHALLGGERISYGFVLGEGLIVEGGSSGAASHHMWVHQFEGNETTSKITDITSDYDAPEYSQIDGSEVTPEEADKEMEKYWNKATDIETQELRKGNINCELWGIETSLESTVDPSLWLNAYINQLPDDAFGEDVLGCYFYDINEDGIPEIRQGYAGGSLLYYLDKNMELHSVVCGICWVLSDKTLIDTNIRYEASIPVVYYEHIYDETTGKYADPIEKDAIDYEEFLKMEDKPNMDNYLIMDEFSVSELTVRLEEMAKHAASTMGVTSEISESREKNNLKNGQEFTGIALDGKAKKKDFQAYLEAYCENYTYMVTEKKFGYMQDYLYYGDEPKDGYDCVTEMQRMLGYDVIDSMTLTSAKIEDVEKTDDNTVQMHTTEEYHAYYNMTWEQINNTKDIYEQCKDSISEDGSLYQVEVNITQKVFYELKLDGEQWKFYRYIDGVEQTTDVINCKES